MEAQLRPDEDETEVHAPEPWTQDGRYVRDAFGAIVVRGRSPADARRIVAAVNGTRGIPSDALESWTAQDVSDFDTRPELEVVLPVEPEAKTKVPPPPLREPLGEEPARSHDTGAFVLDRRVFQTRVAERRQRDRRRRANG